MIAWIPGVALALLLLLFLMAQLQIYLYQMDSLYLEDALAASNLASAVMDLEEYGISGKVLISDVGEAYERYQAAVKANLGLDDNWECVNSNLIAGNVTVERYIVYNVEDDVVTITEYGKPGRYMVSSQPVGWVRAPDNSLVSKTGVYSELSFWVKGLFGVEIQAHKGKLVDIVAQKRGENVE